MNFALGFLFAFYAIGVVALTTVYMSVREDDNIIGAAVFVPLVMTWPLSVPLITIITRIKKRMRS